MRKLHAGLAGLVVVALTACGGSGSTSAPGTNAAAASRVTGGPVVGTKAFTGHGQLAFVSGGRLYVLDGTGRGAAVLHAVATGPLAAGQVPGTPAWSADGKWLAFLVGRPGPDGAVAGGTLWLAGAQGQGARAALPTSGPFEWSPRADVVAALSGTTLVTVRPGQAAHPIWKDPGCTGRIAWAPNGGWIAVSVIYRDSGKRFTGSAIDLVRAGGGVAFNNFASSDRAVLVIDGWWDAGNGLLAWSEPAGSASRAAGGLPLVAYGLDSGPYDVTLARTLPYPSFAVPGPGRGVTLVTGGHRYPWQGQTIASVTAAGTRRPALGAGPGPVNLDPAWAAGGPAPAIAFVHASPKAPPGTGQAALNAWYATRQLWYELAAGGHPVPVRAAGTGVAAPQWSANGQYVLYVRDNALWLIRLLAPDGTAAPGPAARIVSQLFPGAWPDYYAYTAWPAQFAWHG